MAKNMRPSQNNDSMTYAEFTLACIRHAKETTGYAGMHVVWSGFNRAFRKHFGKSKEDTIRIINELADKGVIGMIPWQGGMKLYLPEDTPQKSEAKTDKRADSMLEAVVGKGKKK